MPFQTTAPDWRQAITATQVDPGDGGVVKVSLSVEGGTAVELATLPVNDGDWSIPTIELFVGSEWGRALGAAVIGSYSVGSIATSPNPGQPTLFGRVRTLGFAREVWLNPGENTVVVALRVQYSAVYGPVSISRRYPPRSVSTSMFYR